MGNKTVEKEVYDRSYERSIRQKMFQQVHQFCGLHPWVIYELPRYLVRQRRELLDPMLVFGDNILDEVVKERIKDVLSKR